MGLHRLTSISIGVPDVPAAAAYYEEWGLTPLGDATFATADGGQQLRLVPAARRHLAEIGIGVDDQDDVDKVAASLRALGLDTTQSPGRVQTVEPIAGFTAIVSVAPRIEQDPEPATPYNGPGRTERPNVRAPGIERQGPVRPRKLGHVVIGSVDAPTTQRFFTDGIGFKISDQVAGRAAFMRCSTDHHNVLVQQAPVNFLHHTSWQLEDVDQVGRGAMAMLEEHPERHAWGLGRHHIGSNFFWYLRDPAGNFTEYYSDMDCIVDDQLWKPGLFGEGRLGLYNWGPPPPASFLHPEDLAALMTGAHQRA